MMLLLMRETWRQLCLISLYLSSISSFGSSLDFSEAFELCFNVSGALEHLTRIIKCFKGFRYCFSLLFVIIVMLLLASADETEKDGVEKKEENPSLVKIIFGIFGKNFPPSSWELIQGAMHKIQLKLYPPNLDFRSSSKEGEDKGEKVKEAAKKILEVKKLLKSLQNQQEVLGEVVHKTAEEVTKQTSHDEL